MRATVRARRLVLCTSILFLHSNDRFDSEFTTRIITRWSAKLNESVNNLPRFGPEKKWMCNKLRVAAHGQIGDCSFTAALANPAVFLCRNLYEIYRRFELMLIRFWLVSSRFLMGSNTSRFSEFLYRF